MTTPMPADDGAAALAGRCVLVPRGGAWGERVARLLAGRGATPVIAPLIRTTDPRDLAARDRAFAGVAEGAYEWVFLTSAASVEQLHAAGVDISAGTHIAAVGRATARAVIDAGYDVDFVPAGRSSAATMIDQWCALHDPTRTGRCLVLRSDLAMAVVSDELEVRGYDLEVCIAYRTVGVDLDPAVRDRVRSGEIDTVLITSTSVARELAHQIGTFPPHAVLASLGPGTTKDAERRGFPVTLTSPDQSIESLILALPPT